MYCKWILCNNVLLCVSGLLEDSLSDVEAECCDVRWDSKSDNSSKGTFKRTHPSCQHGTSLSSSANSRLCNSRLKLCLLVLVLLHTVATITASHNLSTMSSLEENSTNEEWQGRRSSQPAHISTQCSSDWLRYFLGLLTQDGITVDMQSTKQTNGQADRLCESWRTNLIQCHEQGTTPQPFVERDLSRVEFSRTIFFTLCQIVLDFSCTRWQDLFMFSFSFHYRSLCRKGRDGLRVYYQNETMSVCMCVYVCISVPNHTLHMCCFIHHKDYSGA